MVFGVTTNGLKPDGALPDFLDLAPNGKARKMLRLRADKLSGPASVSLTGTSGPDKDTILRAITVVPDGFPAVGSVSDMLEKGTARGSITLPKDMVPGTLKVRLEMYPTSMADLVKGLDGLLREPYGCFEQTSTTNYPNTLVLDYINRNDKPNPQVAARAKDLLDKGYAKLTSFECPDTPLKARQGFEWFGGADMQHEALTAYGLLQFKDMARVHPVDPTLIKRTQAFLLSRKDGNGGFHRNARRRSIPSAVRSSTPPTPTSSQRRSSRAIRERREHGLGEGNCGSQGRSGERDFHRRQRCVLRGPHRQRAEPPR